MRRIAFLILAFFIVVIVCGCGSPEQSVKMFLKYRITGEDSAAKLYCTDELAARLDKGDITHAYLGFGEVFGVKVSWGMVKDTISMRTVDETKDNAKLAMASAFGDVIYTLERIGGMWKINEIEGLEDFSIEELEDEIKDALEISEEDLEMAKEMLEGMQNQ